MLKELLFTLGLNVRGQSQAADVLDIIRKLRPKDCGKDLIRIGGNGDGGYLIPDDLEGIEYCFSPGVGPMADFENDLADRGIRSFLADYSVDSPPLTRPEFTFDKKFLGSTDSGPFITLASWKDKYLMSYTGDMILQMDIEGFEYQVLVNTPDKLLNQFRIIVIEFHSLHRLFDLFDYGLFLSCFGKLLENFYVVHAHPCNSSDSVTKGNIKVPRLMELTFLNKRRVTCAKPQRVFPHKLDADCTRARPPLALPKCWYDES
jgi:hypothetical protein